MKMIPEEGKKEKVEDIEKWFSRLQNALRELFENKQLKLELSLEEMCFKIKLPDREAFGLDERGCKKSCVYEEIISTDKN